MGDYHQSTDLLTNELNEICSSSNPVSVIFLGDYDVHTAAQLSDFGELLSKFDADCYLLRGNHDLPVLWQDRGIADLLETNRLKLLQEIDILSWGTIAF